MRFRIERSKRNVGFAQRKKQRSQAIKMVAFHHLGIWTSLNLASLPLAGIEQWSSTVMLGAEHCARGILVMARAYSQLPYSCRSMLFFGGETNSLIKGSSLAVVLEDRVKVRVSVMVLVIKLVSMLIKHVDGEVGMWISVRGSVRRVRCGGILVELL